MKPSNRRIATTLACCLVILPLESGPLPHNKTNRTASIPRYVLWAWERPEDLRFIDPDHTAVAFLANTVRIRGDEVLVHPRLQSILVPNSAKLIAVSRIEAARDAARDRGQVEPVAAAIAQEASLPRVVAVQVDFDATRSQRDFYRALLLDLRQRLPSSLPISITALASWCFDDDWISTLPIDEAVPMLFRMGAGTTEVVARLSSGRDFRSQLCQDSLGLSTDERWTTLPGGRRVYVFHPGPWTEQTELAFLREVRQWH